jgi:hypothetical protein
VGPPAEKPGAGQADEGGWGARCSEMVEESLVGGMDASPRSGMAPT